MIGKITKQRTKWIELYLILCETEQRFNEYLKQLA
jgi:hypothetical protein